MIHPVASEASAAGPCAWSVFGGALGLLQLYSPDSLALPVAASADVVVVAVGSPFAAVEAALAGPSLALAASSDSLADKQVAVGHRIVVAEA
jgi:hypothetical protein